MIVFVWGNLTADNFTPRADKDTSGGPGQEPGLSASETAPMGRKAQAVDLNRLKPPLKAFPDKPEEGGMPGHVAIAPADPSGGVDEAALRDWASSRKSGSVHPFTQVLLDAVVQTNVWSEP